jgi:hypothetical protein
VRNAFGHTSTAVKAGISSFGMFELLGSLVGVVTCMQSPISIPMPKMLDRRNPVLDVPQRFGWLMVFVSIVIIGPVESIFSWFRLRGLLSLYRSTPLAGACVPFIDVLLRSRTSTTPPSTGLPQSCLCGPDGLRMAHELHLLFLRRNLLIPALIHGLYDAGVFLSVAISPSASTGFRSFMVLAGSP